MASFSTEERNALYSLFTLDEHEVREGSTSKDKLKIQWFTYVRREAIQTRLDSLFFGEWELYFLDPKSPAIYHNSHVDCSMGLAIRGIRREYNGSQSGGGEYGAKGAATDALKRVASLWGIGLYLQQSPQIWTENYRDANNKIDWKKKDAMQAEAMRKVSQWLKSIGATGEIFNHNSDDSSSLEIDDYIGDEDKPAQLQAPKQVSDDDGVKRTDDLEIIEARVNNAKKRYYIAGGCTFFSRDVFRDLGFSDTTLENLENNSKTTVLMSEKFRIAYTENAKGFKTPLRVMRVDTGQVVEVKKGS